MTAAQCSAPTAAAGSGEGPGPGCGPRGAGRPGARAPEFAEDPGARREWPKVLSPEWDAEVELRVGSLGVGAGGEWRSCGSGVARRWKAGRG